jgi:hypothetical protein
VCQPKICAESACTQSAPGSLSTVIVAAGSKAPNAECRQLEARVGRVVVRLEHDDRAGVHRRSHLAGGRGRTSPERFLQRPFRSDRAASSPCAPAPPIHSPMPRSKSPVRGPGHRDPDRDSAVADRIRHIGPRRESDLQADRLLCRASAPRRDHPRILGDSPTPFSTATGKGSAMLTWC